MKNIKLAIVTSGMSVDDNKNTNSNGDINISNAISWMKRNNIDTAIVNYSGSGDSGSVDSLEFFKAGKPINEKKDLPTDENLRFDKIQYLTKTSKNCFQFKELNCDNFFRDLCYQALNCSGNSGWEIDSGSSGYFQITSDGQAKLAITNFSTEEETSVTYIDIDKRDEFQKVLSTLKDQGITLVEVEYSGSGDSGDAFHVSARDENGDIELPDVKIELTIDGVAFNRESNAYEKVKKTSLKNLDDAISHIANKIIYDAGHSGYENNEGGCGLIEIRTDVSKSKAIMINHTDFIKKDGDECVYKIGSGLLDPIVTAKKTKKGAAIEP